MKFGNYTDRGLDKQNLKAYPWNEVKVNSYGYRCPEFEPMPEGKKNAIILGCSHTFGQGNADNEHWVSFLSQHNGKRIRYWNLGVPGASGDACVRRLWGTQNLLDPKFIIMCWPDESRREDIDAKYMTQQQDIQNFLHNVFWTEKFAQVVGAKTFHTFAHDPITHEDIKNLNVLEDYTIKNCWPYWNKFEQRVPYNDPSLASDGKHFGVEHHKRFAELFLAKFGHKFK